MVVMVTGRRNSSYSIYQSIRDSAERASWSTDSQTSDVRDSRNYLKSYLVPVGKWSHKIVHKYLDTTFSPTPIAKLKAWTHTKKADGEMCNKFPKDINLPLLNALCIGTVVMLVATNFITEK